MAPSTTGPGGRTSAGVMSHISSTGSALGQVEEDGDKTTGTSKNLTKMSLHLKQLKQFETILIIIISHH